MPKRLLRIALGLFAALALLVSANLISLHFHHPGISFHVMPRTGPEMDRRPNFQVLTEPGDFAFHSLDGNEQHLYASKGQVLFVNRWGTWCGPCVAEMPSIQKLYDRYRNDPQVKFLIIASLDSPADIRSFAVHHHLDLPFYYTSAADTSGVDFAAFPSTLLYAKDGKLSSKRSGATDWSAPGVIEQIEALKRQ